MRGFYLDDLLMQLSVAPEYIVVLPSFYFDGLLIHLLVDLALEWSSVVCSSNEGIGSRQVSVRFYRDDLINFNSW